MQLLWSILVVWSFFLVAGISTRTQAEITIVDLNQRYTAEIDSILRESSASIGDQPHSGRKPMEHGDAGASSGKSRPVPRMAHGWIALIERGGCGFIEKIRHAQAAGASAAIVGDHEGIGLIAMIADAWLMVARRGRIGRAHSCRVPAPQLLSQSAAPCHREGDLHHGEDHRRHVLVMVGQASAAGHSQLLTALIDGVHRFTYDSFLASWLFYTALLYIVMSMLWAVWHVLYGPVQLSRFQDALTTLRTASNGAAAHAAGTPTSPAEHARHALHQLRMDLQSMWRRLDSWRAAEEQVRQLPLVPFSTAEASAIDDFPTRCAVCLDDFVDGDRLRLLPCRHRFHAGCVDRWLITQRRLDVVALRAQQHNIATTTDSANSAASSTAATDSGQAGGDISHRRTVSATVPQQRYWTR
ncbi:hypothetical protein SYNPS1DRAFT_26993 [Syncephalis pseudoplumigaleata]|uniref:RING-type E3 ubiquitin transferase n=1 Tax=Syncephalis pseudoplumigaleata TaxID=1712513 RepID=A0A4P9Z682_9FUNG|nr:hypothetical protein SYNPS1DRAFT_26993 [Syncephalis pseudoplumigaleata]|eukprot:RKP27351.1 hypothetical protein SYNPS1DRAFT_26993 [Syncephalis pseudoplumigaleata]